MTVTSTDRAELRSWLPGYLALALIWGSSFLFIKIGIRELPPLYVSLGRVAVGAVTVLIAALVMRARLPRDLRTWGHLTVVGAVGVALPFTLFAYGEQHVSSVLAGIWNATTPLFVLPIAALAFRTEHITARRATGIGIGFVGVLVVLGVWQGAGGSSLSGQLMCLGAAACYGVAIPYQRRFLSAPGGSGLGIPAGQLVTGSAILLVAAPLLAGSPPAPAGLSMAVVASVLALGALGTGLAFILNFRVIRYAGASTSASVTYLLPVVATVVGVAVSQGALRWPGSVAAPVGPPQGSSPDEPLLGPGGRPAGLDEPKTDMTISTPTPLTSADLPRDETVGRRS